MEGKLSGVPETMLITLWAKAAETLRSQPLIKDEKSLEIIGHIDYDFGKFENSWKTQTGVAVRTMLIDDATRGFISKNPESVIINLGAGLDTRFFRVDNGKILWYDLDLPEVITIRSNFFSNSDRYRMIPGSMLDDEWIDEFVARDRPILIIAEGVLMYFEEREVRRLIERIAAAFPGAEMLLDTVTPAMVNRAKYHDTASKMNVEFRWGISTGREIESYNEKVRFIAEWSYFDYGNGRWRWMGWMMRIPAIRKRFNNGIVHLRFPGTGPGRPL